MGLVYQTGCGGGDFRLAAAPPGRRKYRPGQKKLRRGPAPAYAPMLGAKSRGPAKRQRTEIQNRTADSVFAPIFAGHSRLTDDVKEEIAISVNNPQLKLTVYMKFKLKLPQSLNSVKP